MMKTNLQDDLTEIYIGHSQYIDYKKYTDTNSFRNLEPCNAAMQFLP